MRIYSLLGSIVCFGLIVISKSLISNKELSRSNDVHGINKLISPTYALTTSNGILLFVSNSFKV
jgi:hypothetical protein